MRSVQKVMEYLKIILENNSNGKSVTVFETDDSRRLGYAFREAISVLRRIDKDHEKYNNYYLFLRPLLDYQFKERGERVIAERTVPYAREVKEIFAREVIEEKVTEEIAVMKEEPLVTDIYSLISFISENHTHDYPIIYFPNYIESDAGDRKKLERWCSINNYEVIHKENGITLSKK